MLTLKHIRNTANFFIASPFHQIYRYITFRPRTIPGATYLRYPVLGNYSRTGYNFWKSSHCQLFVARGKSFVGRPIKQAKPFGRDSWQAAEYFAV